MARGRTSRSRLVPTLNLVPPSNVTVRELEGGMSLLKRLLGKSEPPKQRIRICVECGMPVAEHKAWCSILRGQAEMNQQPTLQNQQS
jgi:hypothetical protein